MADFPGDARERVLFEGQRVTIIVNAAGALALLVFLHAIWPQAGALSLKRFVLYGIAAFAAGAGVALIGYVVRYWALSRNKNAGLIHQIAHIWIPVIAVACFVAGLVLPGRRTGLARQRAGTAGAGGARQEAVGRVGRNSESVLCHVSCDWLTSPIRPTSWVRT